MNIRNDENYATPNIIMMQKEMEKSKENDTENIFN